ncbi:MAG: hypothetical protein COB67_08585 [SAR324 cluster bacterium]|uniref:DUF202 domain-containing protein n=1 Tax=SAR324 cluster bacterium TaxID=2024889 RepID=A0A2A4T173_9DELT|nr:MAG: hypothetical protein COB67_08585 [SAR324 cluster bacterium]
MSYLEDPRVFLATERTLLAWIRTEISILALAFLMKKIALDSGGDYLQEMGVIVFLLCGVTVVLSVLASIQTWISLSKLGAIEVPGPMAKPLVFLGAFISILLSTGATYIVAAM